MNRRQLLGGLVGLGGAALVGKEAVANTEATEGVRNALNTTSPQPVDHVYSHYNCQWRKIYDKNNNLIEVAYLISGRSFFAYYYLGDKLVCHTDSLVGAYSAFHAWDMINLRHQSDLRVSDKLSFGEETSIRRLETGLEWVWAAEQAKWADERGIEPDYLSWEVVGADAYFSHVVTERRGGIGDNL